MNNVRITKPIVKHPSTLVKTKNQSFTQNKLLEKDLVTESQKSMDVTYLMYMRKVNMI